MHRTRRPRAYIVLASTPASRVVEGEGFEPSKA
jgi:hypothetical protein